MAVPRPYDRLLVHEHHMTETVEAYYNQRVAVQILAHHADGDIYARQILLALEETGRIAQYGVVRVNLAFCNASVKRQILDGRIPFGRILVEHDVLRRIEPQVFLRVNPGPEMMAWLQLETPKETYGRLALIHCESKPAVELLEIVAPVDEAKSN